MAYNLPLIKLLIKTDEITGNKMWIELKWTDFWKDLNKSDH